MISSLSAVILITTVLGVFAYYFKTARSVHLLPPGPRGAFFSGVKSQLPKTEPWKTYAEWSKAYQSPVISFRVYNRTIVVLNDVTSIRTLLDQRANNYSERPLSWMYNVICGRGEAIFNISATNPRHRIYRRLLQGGLGRQATKASWPMMRAEATIMLDGLMGAPGEWAQHIRRNAAGVVMKLAFGYTVRDLDDPFIKVTEESSKISGWATAPGRWMVDYYPILRFVPYFFPGAHWKRQGLMWREQLNSLSEVPHIWVKEQMAKESYEECFTSRLLRPDNMSICESISKEEEDDIRWCAGGLYAGAADTTVSALTSFVLLMALHPEVQQEAQREVDVVYNQNTATGFIDTPDPSELERLKYLIAIMKEVLRYAPVANLALPHCVAEEDEYMGYRLPKGVTVMPNIWAIMHDPALYPDPFTFSPERFIKTSIAEIQADPRQFAFGFGRRVCPGLQFAETSVLLNMASILARFQVDVLPPAAIDSTQAIAEKSDMGMSNLVEFTTGITSHIKSFPVRILPRSISALQSP